MLGGGILIAFFSIWGNSHQTLTRKKTGLSFIEFLKTKIKNTWIWLSGSIVLIVMTQFSGTHFIFSTFFIAGAVAFLTPVIFGEKS